MHFTIYKLLFVAYCFTAASASPPATKRYQKNMLDGAWVLEQSDTVELLLFTDGYFSHTAYTMAEPKFLYTYGGNYKESKNAVRVEVQFDTRSAVNVGSNRGFEYNVQGDDLNAIVDGQQFRWRRLDKAESPLAGAWHITQRMQDGQLQTIHQAGTRKTIKLLTGSRFQWVAIDPAAKGFYGTGGGSYTFRDGKYIEQILFFSRDDSRVGASLQFNADIKEGQWHHSGNSSKGAHIYEIWSREKAAHE